jgi:hypothetical protein
VRRTFGRTLGGSIGGWRRSNQSVEPDDSDIFDALGVDAIVAEEIVEGLAMRSILHQACRDAGEDAHVGANHFTRCLGWPTMKRSAIYEGQPSN